MSAFRPEKSLYALLSFYLLVLTLVGVLLVREIRPEPPAFLLSHAVAVAGAGQNFTEISVYGENLRPDLSGILMGNLVNEDAFLWHSHADIDSRALDVEKDLLLASFQGTKLITMKIEDGPEPEFLGSLDLQAGIDQIEIVGEKALLGLEKHEGFALVDLHDPSHPRLDRRFPKAGVVKSMVYHRGSVYFADLYSGVGRFDLTAKSPVAETLVSLESPWQMAISGTKMAVGTLHGKVYLFDVVPNGQLVEVGVLDSPGSVRGIAFSDETLAVVQVDGRMNVFNLLTWPKLSAPLSVDLPGRPLQIEPVTGRAQLAVSLVGAGVVLVDVQSPEKPVLAGQHRVTSTFHGLKVGESKVYGTGVKGLEIFDLNAIEKGQYSTLAAEALLADDYYSLQSWSGHVYGYRNGAFLDFSEGVPVNTPSVDNYFAVADEGGVRLFEKNEDGQIRRAGPLFPVTGAQKALFSEGLLYVVSLDGLRIFSGDQPEELFEIGRLPLSGRPVDFEILEGGFLLIVNRDHELLVVDIHDPQNPLQVVTVVTPPHIKMASVAQDVLVDGHYAYVSYGVSGVYVFDLTFPDHPILQQIISTPGHAQQMVVYEDLLLVADGMEGVFVVDVKNRQRALPCGSWPTPLRANQIAVASDGLVISSYPAGAMKLPLPRRISGFALVDNSKVRIEMEKLEEGQYSALIYDKKGTGEVRVVVE